ncbi:MAG TPA: AlpA family phage regulatory protein [Dyella sp.]|uniref:AlpA family phage regulatory protein n=1 Tax=Dyella sp. TaxID=1869338 RepID=UPI002BE78AD9|nr:AlpA family phage regulatory protein [Dyella sp.]HUB89065.1 AlpA family phage regulatory protein [Dyella sp.]
MSERIYLPTIERLPQVVKRTGLPKSSIYRLMAANKFPRSVTLTDGNSRGWDSRAITEWIETRTKGVK